MKYLAALVVAMVLVGCGKKEIAPATPEAPPTALQITVEEGLAVMLRAEKKADQVCYDGDRYGWFVHWNKWKNDDGTDSNWFGWYYTDKIDFFYLGTNKSWFIKDIPYEKYVLVHPDVTGLPCKTQIPQ